MFGRRHDWVEGEFEVTSVVVTDISSGSRTTRVSGRLVREGTDGAVVTTTRTRDAGEPLPEQGLHLPATWRSDKPDKHRIDWGDGVWEQLAAANRNRRAAALGIDPSALTPVSAVPPGMTARAAATLWGTNAMPLPDGTAPVEVAEADRLKMHGEAANAVIAAIAFLKPIPGTTPDRGSSLADVALQVTRSGGTHYRCLARFGFRSAQRREQIGHAGVTVPVRIDPADPSRVTLDSARLPPLG